MPTSPPIAMHATAAALPLDLVVDVQDHLVGVASDLERLQRLLAEASGTLLRAWASAAADLAGQADAASRAAAEALARSSPALQFEDLASQLLAHSGQRLRHCADRLADQAFDGSFVEDAPGRPSPVVQDRLDGGSVELF